MNIFTQHPRAQGISYIEHLGFAMGIARRLLKSVFAFALHAVLPFIPIDPQLDLEATAQFLEDNNDYISTVAGSVKRAYWRYRGKLTTITRL